MSGLDAITPYGFTYGPATVERLAHIPDRGRVLEIRTDHACLQVLISEKGRKITPYRMPKPRSLSGDRDE